MSMLITILILAALMITGVGIVAYFAYKTVKVQQEMIMNIAMFKKASDPFHLGMMAAAMKATETFEEPKVEEDPNDAPSIPQNPSDEAMATLRAHI